MTIRFDRSLRNALALVGPMFFAAVALADGQAVILVEDDAALPGPIIVVRNDAPGLDLRAALRDAVLSVNAQLREPRDCIRGIALVPEGGEPIGASDTGSPSALLKGLAIDAGLFSIRRSGGSSMPAQPQVTPPQVVQPQLPQPQLPQPQVTQPHLPRGGAPPVQSAAPPAREAGPAQSRGGGRSSGISIGMGVAIGSALFDFLRNRCESSLQARFALPSGVAPEGLTVQVVVGARGDPDQVLALQLRLQPADGEWVGVAP